MVHLASTSCSGMFHIYHLILFVLLLPFHNVLLTEYRPFAVFRTASDFIFHHSFREKKRAV